MRTHQWTSRPAGFVVVGLACMTLAVAGGPTSNAATKNAVTKPKAKAKPSKPTAPKNTAPTTAASILPAATVAARGKLTVGVWRLLAGLDPVTASGDITFDPTASALYDALMDVPFGKSPTPMLAESLNESADRRSWALRLRSGVRFHDGTNLTADAVKLNLERFRKSRTFAQSMSLIKTIEVTGPLSLTLSVDKPYASMPYLLGGTVGIMLSPKAIQESADKLNSAPTDAGTGPYKLKEFVPNDHALVVRNPEYWGDQRPRLEQIRFNLIPDEGARYTALKSGDINVDVTLLPGTVRLAREDGFVVVDPPIAGSGQFLFNNSKPPFDDLRIRRAAALAQDRRTISTIFEDPNFELQGFGLWPKGNPWFSPGDELPFDRDEARKLVSAYIKDTGKDAAFTLTVLNIGGPSLDVARLRVRYWQDAGMDVKLQVVPDVNQFVVALVTGQYQAASTLIALEKDPDATAYPLLYSASPSNFSRYQSAEMDAALEAGRTAADPAARKAAYADVQRIFRRDLPFIVGSPGTEHYVTDKKVCGLGTSGGFTAKTVGLGNC